MLRYLSRLSRHEVQICLKAQKLETPALMMFAAPIIRQGNRPDRGYALSVSKHLVKSAVKRNAIKRQLKSALAMSLPWGYHVLVVYRRSVCLLDHQKMSQQKQRKLLRELLFTSIQALCDKLPPC